jgi:hypothetical protein
MIVKRGALNDSGLQPRPLRSSQPDHPVHPAFIMFHLNE